MSIWRGGTLLQFSLYKDKGIDWLSAYVIQMRRYILAVLLHLLNYLALEDIALCNNGNLNPEHRLR